jgi:nucleotide-binding universal stress UspA family protein
MKDISRVMACVDLSDYSVETIESALALAHGTTAEILLLNVIDSRELDEVKGVSLQFPDKVNVDSFVRRVKEERARVIGDMLDEHFGPHKDRLKVIFRVGIPYKTMLEAITEENVDLVVIASKGKSNLIGTLHGSNGERVFRHSSVPVLSVRNRERFGQHRSSRR